MPNAELAVSFVRQSDDAILIEDANGKKIWLPKSQLTNWDHNTPEGVIVEIVLAEWLAIKEGLV